MSLRAARCLRSVVSHATIEQHHVDPSDLRGTMPDLPSGTVTFLFDDIEGSTERWERNPSSMRAASSGKICNNGGQRLRSPRE